jgi:hypothetical protein
MVKRRLQATVTWVALQSFARTFPEKQELFDSQ